MPFPRCSLALAERFKSGVSLSNVTVRPAPPEGLIPYYRRNRMGWPVKVVKFVNARDVAEPPGLAVSIDRI